MRFGRLVSCRKSLTFIVIPFLTLFSVLSSQRFVSEFGDSSVSSSLTSSTLILTSLLESTSNVAALASLTLVQRNATDNVKLPEIHDPVPSNEQVKESFAAAAPVRKNVTESVEPRDRTKPASIFPIKHNKQHDAENEENEESFSACLLIMDDNFRLTEWISYHYFVLPLRYLVVAVDPHSKTSPSAMLDRWRDRMTIVEWTDADFTDKQLISQPTDHFSSKTDKYLIRQTEFYRACAHYLHAQNRTWTSFHDVDEYIVVTKRANASKQLVLQQPGSILKIVKFYSNHKDTGHREWENHFSKFPCVTLPRVLFGTVNSSDEEVNRDVPSFIDAQQFDTLYYRYQGTSPGERDGLAKSIMDLSRIPNNLFLEPFSIHRPIPQMCPPANVEYTLPLGIHHYLGSWEAYSFREDSRKGSLRSIEIWQERSVLQGGGPNDDARPWITGFVNMMGESAAKDLLRDAGLPRDYKKPENESATWVLAQELRERRNRENKIKAMYDQKDLVRMKERNIIFETPLSKLLPRDDERLTEWVNQFEPLFLLGKERAKDEKEESFSACLLVMDDNFRLAEWISYHYFVLPLRYLVVAVDPHSKTSPSPMLDRWRDRMTIVEWTDDDFATRNFVINSTDSVDTKKHKHRGRQVSFYQACAEYLKTQNRTWTSFHDIDEYLVVTKRANVSKELARQPGIVLKTVKLYSQRNGTGHDDWEKHFSQSACVTIPRVLFGTVNSSDEEVFRDVPSFVDARQFDTLQYRYQATPLRERDGLAKSIIDVSRIPNNLSLARASAHRPIPTECPHAFQSYDLPLGIHHYLGSWEAFSFREDARKGTLRTLEKWQERSVLKEGGINDDARMWIAGFVELVGETAAKELLQDAGLPRDYRKPENESATWVSLLGKA